MVQIGELTKLKVLWVENTAVTDAGLIHLTRLKRLEIVNLQRTKVTMSGIAELQRSLPNATIYHSLKE